MTSPMFNPQPNYSGVTIQISNPAVYAGQGYPSACVNGGCCGVNNQGYVTYPQGVVNPQIQSTNMVKETGYQNAYPAQYYLNNYDVNGDEKRFNSSENIKEADKNSEQVLTDIPRDNEQKNNAVVTKDANIVQHELSDNVAPNSYKIYADKKEQKENDMSKSQNIITDLAEREAEIQEEKKNTKETKIVALTDEYIKSLENYLNNPNDEIRLMASKEILTRLDEDKERYDDAALNALLNKMMQDPNKLVRVAALSAFASQLASGNDYTVKLLHNIQSNPNADKEDVLQAADILLKMSAGVEVKNIPNPSVKDKQEK